MRRLWYAAFLLSLPVHAATTRFAEFNTFASLEKGRLVGVTLSARGELTLAPAVRKLAELGEPLVWCLGADHRGNLYVGTGNEGKVFRIGRDGTTVLVFDAEEPEVYALAVAPDGTLYVAPSIGGKIFAVPPTGEAVLWTTLPCSYVWSLAVDTRGVLYAATGEKAGLYRVVKAAAPEMLFSAGQAHLRSIVVAGDGTLFAGSSRSGHLYRVTGDGKAFTLYDAAVEELHALALGPGAAVYAAGLVESREGTEERGEQAVPAEEESEEAQEVVLPPARITPRGVGRAAGAVVYAIDPVGNAAELWRSQRESILALAVTRSGKVVAGSNEKGKLLTIQWGEDPTLLTTVDGEQVTAILADPEDVLYVATSHPGRVFRVGPEQEQVGTYESEVIDARVVAQWGQVRWKALGAPSLVRVYTRSGNTKDPDETWSPWSRPYLHAAGEQVESPPARFLQWKAELRRGGSGTATVSGVSIAYRQKNLPPQVSGITVLPPGEYYAPPRNGREEGQLGEAERTPRGLRMPRQLGKSEQRTGWRTASWRFSDPNDDYLLFSLSYRRVGAKSWRRLVTDLDNSYYSWDSRLMPDGEYELQVEASDAPSNADGEALQASRLSEPFVVDNTGPQVEPPRWDKKAGKAVVEVRDQWNVLQRVEYALDAGRWMSLQPRDGVLDGRQEVFEMQVKLAPGEEKELVIRAVDAVGNVGFGYVTVRGE
ncbi:MAG: hypothetical protein ACUVWA_04195 [Candidatus Oleimicrobiaceae bacterium]